MLLNSAIAVAILAFAAAAVPTPTGASMQNGASNTTNLPTSTPPLPPKDALLTQKLFLADTAADRFALLPVDRQFIFDFNAAEKGKAGAGGDLVAANRKTFPALVGTGSGMAVGFLKGCGFNTPHVHPRATELQLVTKGTLVTEMVPENGVFNEPGQAASKRRVIRNELTALQMQPFYQGSVHAQFNPDCGDAEFVASFNAEDFGAGQVVDEVVAMSDDVVVAALGTQVFGDAKGPQDLERFRKSIPASIAQGVETCMKKCGIQPAAPKA
ncbi:RmlC-like cupin domain-containing protein [Amylocarpus encephaloides]|uniref:RmlC-like cupin domain-containing protein n=1 Tax=Amylocarpus encephaloides TaxID=45428 RepID=A0A9P7YEL9_9HELO|nr:RmlC-like cupin domain-containing protein [Amylocarpus encephaloides]